MYHPKLHGLLWSYHLALHNARGEGRGRGCHWHLGNVMRRPYLFVAHGGFGGVVESAGRRSGCNPGDTCHTRGYAFKAVDHLIGFSVLLIAENFSDSLKMSL